MIITCVKDQKWSFGEYKKDQDLIVGEHITDKQAEDMLKFGYAIPKKRREIETKVKEIEKPQKAKSKKKGDKK